MELTVVKFTSPIVFLSIYIMFTFMPIIYKYAPIFGTIRIVLIAGFCLLLSYLSHSKEYNNYNAWNNRIFKTWLFFLIIMMLGIIVSHDRGLTLSIIETIVRYLLVMAIMVKIIDSEPRLDFVIKLFSICGVVMAASIGMNFSSGINYANSIRGAAIGSGLFADPNDLALFLNSILPFLFYFYFKAKKKYVPLFAIVLVEIAVVLTYSRGGFLGSCAVLISVIYFRKAERRRLLTLILAAIILFVVFAPEQYKERLSTITEEGKVDPTTGKYSGRMQTWLELLPEGMKSPVLGAGAGCSWYLAGIKDNSDWHAVHNTFLQVFLEMGFLGLFCYLTFYTIPFRHYRSFKAKVTGADASNFIDRYQFILVSLIGFAATAFFIPQAYSPILFILSGITVIQYELAERALTGSKSNANQMEPS